MARVRIRLRDLDVYKTILPDGTAVLKMYIPDLVYAIMKSISKRFKAERIKAYVKAEIVEDQILFIISKDRIPDHKVPEIVKLAYQVEAEDRELSGSFESEGVGEDERGEG